MATYKILHCTRAIFFRLLLLSLTWNQILPSLQFVIGYRILIQYIGASARLRVMDSEYEASQSHSLETPYSARLLWTSDQPDTDTSTEKNNINKTQTSMPTEGFEHTILVKIFNRLQNRSAINRQ
jgi:hypothetical protein